MAAKEKKRKALSGRFAVFFTILLFVCTVIFLNNQFSSSSLRRISYWIFNGVRGDSTEIAVSFDENEYNRFSLLNGNLTVVSPERISVLKLSGASTLSEPVILRSPAVESSKSRFVAYDIGGLNFYIANNKSILFSDSAKAPILNANMNKSGDLILITDAEDCKTLLTVYDTEFRDIYKFHSSEKYVFDASLSPNGKSIAIAAYGTENGTFSTTLMLGKVNASEFYSSIPLGDSMPLKVFHHSDNKIVVVCDDRTLSFDNDGNLIYEVSHNNLPVKSFDFVYGNHLAVLLDNYQNGGSCKLLLIKSNGEYSSLDIDEDVYSMSCAGKYTCIQLADKCINYKEDLTINNEFDIPTSVAKCLVNSDAAVLSLGDNFGTLYIE